MSRHVAITRAVGTALSNCELTFQARESIDLTEAILQHSAYCDALRQAGIAVEVLPAVEHLPDAVFVEDTAVVLDELAVMTRPGSMTRREEVATVAVALKRHRALAYIEEPGTVDGGDVLTIGRQLFVGLSSRTNEAGYDQLSRAVELHGYRVVPVRVDGCLHLKTALSALDEETLLINPNWIDAGKLGGFQRVQVAEAEPFAANCLVLNGVVHLSARCDRTRERLEQRGFVTRILKITEFEKAEAGLTCLSLVFESEREM
jgi:dimethylargininase